MANLATAYIDNGSPERGMSLSTEAMGKLPRGPEFAIALYAHALAWNALNQHADALKNLREAADIWDGIGRPDRSQQALLKETMANCLGALGYLAKAEAAERESLAIRTREFGADSLGAGASFNNLGVMLLREQRYTEGEEALQKAAAIFGRIGEAGIPATGDSLEELRHLLFLEASKNAALYQMAEQTFRRELAIEEQVFGTSDVRVSDTLERLGETLYREHSYAEAGWFYGRGLVLQQTALGPTHPKTLVAAKRYQELARKMKVATK
ncbi:MAG: tetratricopeptide repeat protein [Ignavibacteriota bacterium]